MKVLRTWLVAGAVMLSALSGGAATAAVVSVAGNAGPWNDTLNPGFGYGSDEGAPTAVSVLGGYKYTIAYVSGLWSTNVSPPFGYVDANGNVGLTMDGFGSPAGFISDTQTLQQLVGTFATAGGVIVGTPFAIGNGPLTLSAPLGAALLLLGANDDRYGDNAGSIQVSVTAETPLPAALPLFASALAAAGFVGWRKKLRESLA
jgi:hypothetical protein